jgi:putative ATPase
MLEGDNSPQGEVLTYSPGDDERERWVRRTESSREPLAVSVRNLLFENWKSRRHDRVLIPSDPSGTLIWEAHRRVPEGGVTALCRSSRSYDALSWLAGGLPAAERPKLLIGSLEANKTLADISAGNMQFDVILGRNWLLQYESRETGARILETGLKLTAPGGGLLLAEPQPGEGTTPAGLLPSGVLGKEEEKNFRECEKEFFRNLAGGRGAAPIGKLLEDAGWRAVKTESRRVGEKRILSGSLLDTWLSPGRRGSYGTEMASLMGEENWAETSARIRAILAGRTVRWETALLIITASA